MPAQEPEPRRRAPGVASVHFSLGERGAGADAHKPYPASNYLRVVQGPDGLWYESSHE
jgi:hypothetical protein